MIFCIRTRDHFDAVTPGQSLPLSSLDADVHHFLQRAGGLMLILRGNRKPPRGKNGGNPGLQMFCARQSLMTQLRMNEGAATSG